MGRFGPGFRVARRRRAAAGAASPPTSLYTMTQLAHADRIYQRSTMAGGGEGKGQGTIPVTINASQAGTVHARCRSAADGVTILQASWPAATISATGSQILDVAGVDARLGWFYLDLLDSSGSWKLGTVPVGMGALIGHAGQSLMVRMLSAQSDTGTRPSDIGVSVPANGRVYAKWTGTYSNDPAVQGWQAVQDALAANNVNNSAGAAELLNLECAARGVNVGFVGSSVGGTSISTWVSGGANFAGLRDTLLAAGGAVEDFHWFQGHADVVTQLRYDQYKAQLVQLWADLATAGITISGRKYVAAIPNVHNTGYGTLAGRTAIRAAQMDWAAETGNVYLGFADLLMAADIVHQTQAGARQIARHFHRAMHNASQGPTVTGVTKSGRDLTLSLAMAPGASLVSAASQATRFLVARAGDLAALSLDATTPITVSPASIALKLASDPGNVPIDVWPMAVNANVQDGTAGAIYDDNDDEGFGVGRQLVARPRPARLRVNTPLSAIGGDSVAYGAARFGNGRTSGRITAAYNGVLGQFLAGMTFDLWFQYAGAPGATQVLVGQNNNFWIGVTATGGLALKLGSAAASGDLYALTPGEVYHVRVVVEPPGWRALVYVNGALVNSFAVATSTTWTIGASLAIGGNGGAGTGSIYTQGWIDEVAIFEGMLVGDFTPPEAPWIGNEAGLLHLWHLDGNGEDSAA